MRKIIIILGAIVFVLLAGNFSSVNSYLCLQSPAYSAITPENIQNLYDKDQPVVEVKKDEGPSALTIFGSLASVIGLILISGWLYSEMNNVNIKKFATKTEDNNSNKFKIISTQHLGPNRSMHLIEIANKRLIIGITPNNINLIADITEKTQSSDSVDTECKENSNIENASSIIDNKESIMHKICDVYKDYIQK